VGKVLLPHREKFYIQFSRNKELTYSSPYSTSLSQKSASGDKSFGRVRPRIEKRKATFGTCQATKLLCVNGFVFLEHPSGLLDFKLKST
jgi:hypothetical protein